MCLPLSLIVSSLYLRMICSLRDPGPHPDYSMIHVKLNDCPATALGAGFPPPEATLLPELVVEIERTRYRQLDPVPPPNDGVSCRRSNLTLIPRILLPGVTTLPPSYAYRWAPLTVSDHAMSSIWWSRPTVPKTTDGAIGKSVRIKALSAAH